EAGGWRLEAGGWRLEAGGWSVCEPAPPPIKLFRPASQPQALLSALPLQGIQQRLILLRRADGDAQELVDAWQLEVAHDDALLAQARRQRRRVLLRMTGEDEVGCRWQHLEAQRRHRGNHCLATGDHLLASLLEVFTILERRGGAGNGDAI